MVNHEQTHSVPSYDRAYLPPARFEFVVMGDTHHILDPEPYAVEFDSVREWPRRADWAIRAVSALETGLVIHLGDLTEENSARPQQAESRQRAANQFARYGVRPYHVAGNMDIGDKPDATMWTEWVTPQSLERFHSQFNPSWYSFDHQGVHFVVLNSQIMNGPLPQAQEQRAWLEADLAANQGGHIFLFMHMPPFFVSEEEPDTGFYNSINQPAREWFTSLTRRYRVAYLFTGHTHFRAFHRIGETRFYIAPSTTTSRAGFYEAFSVAPPPEQGRNDRPKMGFYLVRVYEEGARVHFIRTWGQTGPGEAEKDWSHLLPRTSPDLPGSPVGVFLRTPLAHQSEGALAWPSVLRQRVRDDHPFLAILEGGIRHVRVPMSDLDDPLQRQRLQLLRGEGIQVTAIWLWSDRLDLNASVGAHVDRFDTLELQVPGGPVPQHACLGSLVACRDAFGKPVVLTPVMASEPAVGKYHPRTRFGYQAQELKILNQQLAEMGIPLDRVVCHVGSETAPWDAIQRTQAELPLSHIGGLDYVVGLAGVDDRIQACRVAEALFASALQPDSRLILDPLVDLDRTNDINHGLLDRLSNPRPTYTVLQSLNTLLFSTGETYVSHGEHRTDSARILAMSSTRRRLWLVLPQTESESIRLEAMGEKDDGSVVDLAGGLSRRVRGQAALDQILGGIDTPFLVSSSTRSSSPI